MCDISLQVFRTLKLNHLIQYKVFTSLGGFLEAYHVSPDVKRTALLRTISRAQGQGCLGGHQALPKTRPQKPDLQVRGSR